MRQNIMAGGARVTHFMMDREQKARKEAGPGVNFKSMPQ
jgi:hypothetical protein